MACNRVLDSQHSHKLLAAHLVGNLKGKCRQTLQLYSMACNRVLDSQHSHKLLAVHLAGNLKGKCQGKCQWTRK
jgi:hypothetical protein